VGGGGFGGVFERIAYPVLLLATWKERSRGRRDHTMGIVTTAKEKFGQGKNHGRISVTHSKEKEFGSPSV